MNIRDAFAFGVALMMDDFTETGWTRDPSKRLEAYRSIGILVEDLVTDDQPRDPMLSPPPAHLAEQQLAEFRAAMAGNPPSQTLE